ncbi:MAG: exo-beta-N-acetylmuramidase NamZ family protein [Thermoanaerobaculia bacterium]
MRVGLERVADGDVHVLAGKRVGLIAHAASVTADGRHAIDVLRNAGVEVVRLFAPEHGLRSRAAAGEPFDADRDPVSGLPVVSLYGDRRKPTPADLAGLDALVFDLQDGGVRFYTYVSTLILAVEAAAEAGLEVVVLDRPNPLGGQRVEGPVSVPRDVVPASFLNLAPGPLVHGMTVGEMARLVNDRLPRPAPLEVVAMDGWGRDMVWTDTGLPWVPPSPNLRSAEAALAYPGVALLEATNVSEGRGTTAPFLRFGAPWLDPETVSILEPGFAMRPSTFTPRGSEAAPSPKYADEACRGFSVQVTDPLAASPYHFGIALLHRLQLEPGFAWRDAGDALTRLLGTPRVYEQLTSGAAVEAILAADLDDHAAWRDARRPYLLYHRSDR